MTHGGRLTLRTAKVELDERYAQDRPEIRPGSYVSLTVSNTGDGLTQESLDRLFEPFAGAADAQPASGVGLAAVYGFVKQCGGDIAATSELGQGTKIHLYLPLDKILTGKE